MATSPRAAMSAVIMTTLVATLCWPSTKARCLAARARATTRRGAANRAGLSGYEAPIAAQRSPEPLAPGEELFVLAEHGVHELIEDVIRRFGDEFCVRVERL